MCNTELTKYYLSKSTNLTSKMPETAYFDIIKSLDVYFNHDWTWEFISETFAMNNTKVAATVALYTPGHVYTGRATCDVKEFGNVHLFALVDASRSFMDKPNSQSSPSSQQTQQNTGNMSPEQIMNAINGGGQIDSAAQFYNHKDADGTQSESVPYENISDKAHKEIQEDMGLGNNMNQPQQPSDYSQPKENLHGYSQQQLDRIEAFKKKWDVTNNQMFNNYVVMWDKTMTKANLNPQNIDSFLDWTDRLGKPSR